MFNGSRQPSDGGRPEKSTFVRTCNLLSRYMKEKGTLRDLNLEIGGKVESLEAIVKHGCSSPSTIVDKEKSHEQHPSMPIDSTTSKEVGAAMNSQLTIFYSGKVLVFDDCPADKAKEVMAFAKKQSSHMSYGILGEIPASSGPILTTSSPREGLPPRPQPKPVANSSNTNTCPEKITPQPKAKESTAELPIARRSSLHRFLAKRKDRAAVRGPYYHDHRDQGQAASSSSSKDDEQLELRL